MRNVRWWASFALAGLFSLASTVCKAADLEADCLRGCLSRDGNMSVNLLKRKDADAPVTLRWLAGGVPSEEGESLELYAGNPKRQGQLAHKGTLTFEKAGARHVATWRFTGDELGEGTFLTVVVRRKGSREELVDWRAWRILTTTEAKSEKAPPPPNTEWELQVVPAALRAESGHGALPRSQGGDRAAWWSIVQSQDQLQNLDLDGDSTGLPGLGIQVSVPWAARGQSATVRQALTDKLSGVEGHTVRFESMQWLEEDPKLIELSRQAIPLKLQFRHYYTAVTLYTHATDRSFDKDEVFGWFLPFFQRRFYSHETSARLKQPEDPRFWASYDEREYGSDLHLLELLNEQVKQGRSVTGLPDISREDGDGGLATYHVGLNVSARPWQLEANERAAQFGIVGVEVVASRTGYGRVLTRGSAGGSALEQAWTKVVGIGQEYKALDLDAPPDGYFTAPPMAILTTKSGPLPLLKEPNTVQRGGEEETFPDDTTPEKARDASGVLEKLVSTLKKPQDSQENPVEKLRFPPESQVALSVSLRAGALVDGRSGGNVKSLLPIDTYAQYVLKLTVAMHIETAPPITGGTPNIPGQLEVDVSTAVPPDPPWWSRLGSFVGGWRLMAGVGGLAMITLVVLVIAVPGFRSFLSALFGAAARRK